MAGTPSSAKKRSLPEDSDIEEVASPAPKEKEPTIPDCCDLDLQQCNGLIPCQRCIRRLYVDTEISTACRIDADGQAAEILPCDYCKSQHKSRKECKPVPRSCELLARKALFYAHTGAKRPLFIAVTTLDKRMRRNAPRENVDELSAAPTTAENDLDLDDKDDDYDPAHFVPSKIRGSKESLPSAATPKRRRRSPKIIMRGALPATSPVRYDTRKPMAMLQEGLRVKAVNALISARTRAQHQRERFVEAHRQLDEAAGKLITVLMDEQDAE